jgi:hypothetical protein
LISGLIIIGGVGAYSVGGTSMDSADHERL